MAVYRVTEGQTKPEKPNKKWLMIYKSGVTRYCSY